MRKHERQIRDYIRTLDASEQARLQASVHRMAEHEAQLGQMREHVAGIQPEVAAANAAKFAARRKRTEATVKL